MQDPFNEHVAIFWDYENCTPPCNVPGYDVVNNIRQVAHQYGSVKLFKAYLELSEQSSSKSIGLRSELQSCGVSLTDCPHNGRKDVADKMMIVDMLTYAFDNPAPATIVLISGDRDFVYAVSVLRLRRYRVVVVAPFTAHASLKSQASVVLDWEADIMRRTTVRPSAPEPYYQAPPDDARSPRRPPQSLAFGGTLPSVTPKPYVRRPSFRAAAPAPAAGPEGGIWASGGVPFQSRHLRATSAVAVDSILRSDVPNPTDRSFYRGIARQTAFPSVIGYYDDGVEDIVADRHPIPDIVDVIEDLQESMSRGTPTPSQFEAPTAASTAPFQTSHHYKKPTVEDEIGLAAPSIISVPDRIDAMKSSDAPTENARRTSPPNFAALGTASPVVPVPSSALQPHIGLQGSPVPVVNPRPSLPATASSSPAAIRPTTLPISEQPVVPEAPPMNPSNPPPVVPSIPTPAPPDRSCSISENLKTTEPSGSTLNNAQVKPLVAPKVPSTSPTIFEKFGHLIVIMEDMKKNGSASPLRSTVALRLLQVSPSPYAQAGTGTFKDFSLAAERAGLVTMGGTGGYAWISLRPEYRDLVGGAPVSSS